MPSFNLVLLFVDYSEINNNRFRKIKRSIEIEFQSSV